MKNRYFIVFILILSFECAPASLPAQDESSSEPPVFVMEEVVVTADRHKEKIRKIPANITVITADDIEKSPADTITEILSTEGGLVTRGFLGNDKKSSVDIRGMGETSVSSVLVLVDGIRINPPDMAGPDFTTVALDQVERIEIIRGAGSVLYGDGAVGGVINIITRPAGGKPQARIKADAGSYDSVETTASAQGSLDNFHVTAVGNYSESDGYRENGEFWNKNFDGTMFYDLTDRVGLLAKARFHKDHYGFPGPLTEAQFEENPRQSTDPTDSYSETWEESYTVGLDADLENMGLFTARYTYRERENYSILTLTPGRIDEQTQDITLKHKWDKPFDNHLNELILGLDYRFTEYDQTTSFATKPYEVDHWGYYFLDKLTVAETWVFQAGARRHDYENLLTTTGEKTQWTEDVYTAGTIYLFDMEPDCHGSVFVNYQTSFRIPDVDELGFATEDIRPQKGKHWDVGTKLLWGNRAELHITWFHIDMEDEIWYDSLNNINTNYDLPTKREGLETTLRLYPHPWLKLWGMHTYTDARFEGADYEIPTVPEHKFVAGLHWQIKDWLGLGITYNYVGSRPQGGNPLKDEGSTTTSSGERSQYMPSYETVDAKITYTHKKTNWKVFAGVNNLFDEQYYTNNYYDNVYPAEGRSFSVGMEWTF